MTDDDIKYATYQLYPISCSPAVDAKFYNKNDVQYIILNDNKTVQAYGHYRSVVFGADQNKLLCFSPPSSVRYKKFRDDNYDIDHQIFVNEIVEGVMVNLFYDPRISKWEIATKGSIGGNYVFYTNSSKKTFRQMFMEIFRCSSGGTLTEIAFFENLSTNYCYSFVMQHPKNQIFCPVQQAKLFLVAVYDIHDDGRATYIPPTIYEEWSIFRCMEGIIDFPAHYEFTSFYQLEQDVKSIHGSPLSVGKMIHNVETGERTYLKTPFYENLKGCANPQGLYQYLCMRRIEKTKEFLQYYPIMDSQYKYFDSECDAFIDGLYTSYRDFYIHKTRTQISDKFLMHIRAIHKTIYIPSHKTGKKSVLRSTVEDYFNRLEPREQLYHLNYDRRLLVGGPF